jgi:hypothetical protein
VVHVQVDDRDAANGLRCRRTADTARRGSRFRGKSSTRPATRHSRQVTPHHSAGQSPTTSPWRTHRRVHREGVQSADCSGVEDAEAARGVHLGVNEKARYSGVVACTVGGTARHEARHEVWHEVQRKTRGKA